MRLSKNQIEDLINGVKKLKLGTDDTTLFCYEKKFIIKITLDYAILDSTKLVWNIYAGIYSQSTNSYMLWDDYYFEGHYNNFKEFTEICKYITENCFTEENYNVQQKISA